MNEEVIPMDTSVIEPTPNGSESAIPAPVERKCVMAEIIHPALVELARVAPMNRQLHALLLAKLGKMPPEGADTFDKIKDWVETTFTKPIPAPPSRGIPPRANNTAFVVDVSFEESVSGTCRYTANQSGSGQINITLDEVSSALDGADDIDEVIRCLAQIINEEAYDRIEPDMEDDGDGYDYAHHDVYDSNGVEVTFNSTRLRRNVEEYLRQTLTAERLEELGI